MTKKATSKYTPAMEQTIRAWAEKHGQLNLELATQIADLPEFQAAGVTARGVTAKVRSMGVAYARAERTDKTGQPVERKEETVKRIETALGVSGLDSLSKAEKGALRLLADMIEQMASVEA